MKWILLGVCALVAVGVGVFALVAHNATQAPEPVVPTELHAVWPTSETIGTSVEGRTITAYTYGSGAKHLLFVGGMHGGYEWNSVLLAYQFMDYLKDLANTLPEGLTITVIPSINPDGVYEVTHVEGRFTATDISTDKNILAAGRFNAHKVDLNRNFDCNWSATSTWQGRPVSAGEAAFSEPEAQAIQKFVMAHHPDMVVFWHSQANAVYASQCNGGILPPTLEIMNAYAHASGYPAVKSFDAYPITGDSEGWLASINIPAITVELSTHETTEWDKNLAGIKALFNLYTREAK